MLLDRWHTALLTPAYQSDSFGSAAQTVEFVFDELQPLELAGAVVVTLARDLWMRRLTRTLPGLALCCAAAAFGQSQEREPTDVYIRRLAGLPPETAGGQIQIIDVGHDPMSTMLSIVGNHTGAGWKVSYACASSPHCARGFNHSARTYTLSPAASAEVDQIVERLRSGGDPEDPLHARKEIGGHLLVKIDYLGFSHEYRRTGLWGETLGRLEALLSESKE